MPICEGRGIWIGVRKRLNTGFKREFPLKHKLWLRDATRLGRMPSHDNTIHEHRRRSRVSASVYWRERGRDRKR